MVNPVIEFPGVRALVHLGTENSGDYMFEDLNHRGRVDNHKVDRVRGAGRNGKSAFGFAYGKGRRSGDSSVESALRHFNHPHTVVIVNGGFDATPPFCTYRVILSFRLIVSGFEINRIRPLLRDLVVAHYGFCLLNQEGTSVVPTVISACQCRSLMPE